MKKQKSIPKLKAELQLIFNHFIRLRDAEQHCISCNIPHPNKQAGHYFSVKGYDGLRFDEFNVHGECPGCNCFDESHLIGYGQHIVERIGVIKYQLLMLKAADYKKNGYKWTRSELLEKIEYYKQKVKDLQ